MNKLRNKLRDFALPIRNILILVFSFLLLYFSLNIIPKTKYLLEYGPIKNIFITIAAISILYKVVKSFPVLSFLVKPLKYFIRTISSVFVFLLTFMIIWYSFFFFPDDGEYLEEIAAGTEYRGNDLENKEMDLTRELNKARIINPITKKDRNFLLDDKLRQKEFYIDTNPYYNRDNNNNLKYSTGKIFYYIYQKNSIVLKGNSRILFNIRPGSGRTRFLEFYTAFPELDSASKGNGSLNIYYPAGTKKLYTKTIGREKKPDIEAFRYSNVISSVKFYLTHPGRTVLTENTGWEKHRIELPENGGELEIEFNTDAPGKNFLFLGSPGIYSTIKNSRNSHINIVYLLFDTLARYQIDLYDYYDIFSKHKPEEAEKIIGGRKIVSSSINKYNENICLFENMYTAGQVTRPSIVSLWTSRFYPESRIPIFRNIVTLENQEEFNSRRFPSLAEDLSRNGYFTKQISCNAQGHGVSGVGVDLGFDENYDYTMEASELPENFRRIIKFLEENQNRKFFLYSHINVPHSPKWIPMKYFLSAYPDTSFYVNGAITLGNIRYLNSCLKKILDTVDKLKLRENTIIIITADHSMGADVLFRGTHSLFEKMSSLRESHATAVFYRNAIYTRAGGVSLLDDIMRIPFVVIMPSNFKGPKGKIDSAISTLDVAPTLLDLALNKEENKFTGKSFKRLIIQEEDREKTFNDFIPMAGRFQRGFVLDGRYKYWINIKGLYKYRETPDGRKLLMQQEYLYDLKEDPFELKNLALDLNSLQLVKKIRKLYYNRFRDYPDKNFIYLSPSIKGKENQYRITARTKSGFLYPKTYSKDIKIEKQEKGELVITANVRQEGMHLSFETDPPDAELTVEIYQNDKPLPDDRIFSSVECINIFGNPISLKGRDDFYIARTPGKTGLEDIDIPEGSVYFSRIPLNYWLEMSKSDKDIRLSPGIKEVLRGWGYIQ